MENKKVIIAVAWVGSLILTAGATYFGGNYVQEQQRIQQIAQRTGMSVSQVQQMQQNGGGSGFFAQGGGPGYQGGQNGQGFGGRGNFGGMMGARIINGKIDKVEDGTITLTTRQGGSQKITLADNATISTTTKVNESTLKPGQEVWLNGTRGSDGNFEVSKVVQVQ